MKRTAMSSRELERVEMMGRVASGALKLVHAAEMLELSYRQTKRLWRRYRKNGPEGSSTDMPTKLPIEASRRNCDDGYCS